MAPPPSLIDALIGTATERRDDQMILPVRRPSPDRPRDLLEVIGAMGGQASLVALFRSLDLGDLTPSKLVFIVLSRWPSAAELAACPVPYHARSHLRALLLGQEFRAHLAQRIAEAYPDKRRLLWVRLPRCAGAHFESVAASMHPVFSDALTRPAQAAVFLAELGRFLARFEHTRTLLLSQKRLAPFMSARLQPCAGQEGALPWSLAAPPCRAEDRLFTILREPTGLILSQVNALVHALRAPAAGDSTELARWRARLPMPDPAQADAGAWQAVARAALARWPAADPLCHALGDGTAQGARDACRASGIEIADLSRYDEWVARRWDTRPPPPPAAVPAILGADALTAADRARLDALTAQDQPFYAAVRAVLDKSEPPAITGNTL